METKEQKLLKFNTVEQSNLVLHYVISQSFTIQALDFIKRGYLVTPFVLNLLNSFAYKNKLHEILMVAPNIQADCYEWLKIYWGKDRATKFFVDKNHREVIENYLDVEDLEKYEFWDVLLADNRFEILAQHNQFAKLIEFIKTNPFGYYLVEVTRVLLNHRRFDDLFKLKRFQTLTESREGILYLVEKEQWDFLSKYLILENDFLFDIFYENKQYFYLTHCQDSIKWLAKKGYFHVFVESKCWFDLLYYEKYELIDWEDLLNKDIHFMRGNKSLEAKEYLIKTKQWELFAKRRCHAILFKNWQFKWWWKSF